MEQQVLVPFWFNHTVVTTDGEQLTLSWKVWHSSTRLLWSARPVLDTLGFSGKRTVGKIFKDLQTDLTRSLGLLELSYHDCVLPSRHSQAARGQAISVQDHQQYWCLTSEALLCLLCRMGSTRQMQSRKGKAEAVLAALLERLGHGVLEDLQQHCSQLPPQAGPLCQKHRVGQCLHVGIMLGLLPLRHVKEMGGVLVELFGQANICSKVCWVLQFTVLKCVAAFHQHANAEHLHDSCQADQLLMGPKKRRRIDEDYKAQQTASSSSQAVGSGFQDLARLPRSTVAPFLSESMLAYLFAANESLSHGLNYCLQTDGGRVGKPASLTYFFFVWSLEANIAAALPPQAKHSVSHTFNHGCS